MSTQLEQGRGIAWVRGVPVARYDDADLEKIYWGLSVHLGVVIAQNTRGDHIGHVRDEGLQWGQVSGGELVRGYRTNAYMPFHSDPTDRVGLFCVQKGQSGRPFQHRELDRRLQRNPRERGRRRSIACFAVSITACAAKRAAASGRSPNTACRFSIISRAS